MELIPKVGKATVDKFIYDLKSKIDKINFNDIEQYKRTFRSHLFHMIKNNNNYKNFKTEISKLWEQNII